MPVPAVHCDDRGCGQVDILKLECGCRAIEVKTEIGTVDWIQSAVGELFDLPAFAELGAFGEIVGGDYGLIQMVVEVFKLLVHSFCLLVDT